MSTPLAAPAVPAAAAVPASPVVPAAAAAVPASTAAAGGVAPEVTSTSGSCSSTSSASTSGSLAGSSSCRIAGSGTSSRLLSLRPAGALCQLLPSEGAGGTAGAPSSAQGASTGSGEPRGYWCVHGQLSSSYSAFRYRCYSFFHFQVICRAASYTSFLYEDSYGSYLTWGPDTQMLVTP